MDDMTCFKCKSKGHKSENCNANVEEDPAYDNIEINEESEDNFPALVSTDKNANGQNSVIPDPLPETSAQKRGGTSTASDTSQIRPPKQANIDVTETSDTLRPVSPSSSQDNDSEGEGKSKKDLSIKDLLRPIYQNFIMNTDKYPLTFTNFSLFIDMCKGQQDISSIVDQFDLIEDIPALITTLSENYNLLDNQ